jgi:hypothetical protein
MDGSLAHRRIRLRLYTGRCFVCSGGGLSVIKLFHRNGQRTRHRKRKTGDNFEFQLQRRERTYTQQK